LPCNLVTTNLYDTTEYNFTSIKDCIASYEVALIIIMIKMCHGSIAISYDKLTTEHRCALAIRFVSCAAIDDNRISKFRYSIVIFHGNSIIKGTIPLYE
jgi:hypothetical protein